MEKEVPFIETLVNCTALLSRNALFMSTCRN
jgi:hypothetical protein